MIELYYLKKFFILFESPLILSLIFLLFSLYLIEKNIKRAKITIVIPIFILIIASYPPFSNNISKGLEQRYSTLSNYPKDVRFIVLLGGDFNIRVYEVIKLYKKIQNSKIILFGKDSSYNFLEAKNQYNILLNMGVKKKDVIVDDNPLNTQEEIITIKRMLKNEKFILVTNALHMSRVMNLCKEYKLNAIPSPTNYYTKHKYNILSIPTATSLHQTSKVIHEYLGILFDEIRRLV